MKTSKWKCGHEWLAETSRQWTTERLQAEFNIVAGQLDDDTIQDRYESEMDKAGFFKAGAK